MDFLKKILWLLSVPFVVIALLFKLLLTKQKTRKYLKKPEDFLDDEKYGTVYKICRLFLYIKHINVSKLISVDFKLISKPQIIISNHRSLVDPVVLFVLIYMKTDIRPIFIAKKELEDDRYGLLFKLVDTIVIDRENLRQIYSTIETQKELLKKNKIIVIFPEATRNTNEEMLEFKSGVFEVAYKTMTPIQPVVVINSEFYEEEKKSECKKEIKMSLLPLIQPSSFIHIDRTIFSKNVRNIMQKEFIKLNKINDTKVINKKEK